MRRFLFRLFRRGHRGTSGILRSTDACGLCRQEVEGTGHESCPHCGVGYHGDCWTYLGRICAIYGCGRSGPIRWVTARGPVLAERLLWLAFLVFAGLTLDRLSGRRPEPLAARPPILGHPVDFALTTLTGERRGLRSWGEPRPIVVMSVFDETCDVCLERMPELVELQRTLERDGKARAASLAFFGAPRSTAEFARKRGLAGTVFLDTNGTVSYQYRFEHLATTVIDRDGHLRYRGPPDLRHIRALVDAL